jgi:hypothetical protein
MNPGIIAGDFVESHERRVAGHRRDHVAKVRSWNACHTRGLVHRSSRQPFASFPSGAPFVSSLQPGERASEFVGPEGGQIVNPFANADEVDR